MKTFTFLLLTLATFNVASLTAQNEPVLIGIKTGAQLNNAVSHGVDLGLDILQPQSILGVRAGIFADVPLGNRFYFSPEVAYTQKGFKVSESIHLNVFEFPIPIGLEAVTKSHYIDMPLNLKYKFGGSRVSGYVSAGPTLGYATSAEIQTRVNSIIDFNIANIPINTQGKLYNEFEIGGNLGLGLEAQMGPGKFIAEVKYQHAFTDFTDLPFVDVGLKNNAFGFNIGYAIPLGKKTTVINRS